MMAVYQTFVIILDAVHGFSLHRSESEVTRDDQTVALFIYDFLASTNEYDFKVLRLKLASLEIRGQKLCTTRDHGRK